MLWLSNRPGSEMSNPRQSIIVHAWHDCGVEQLQAVTPMIWVSPERLRPKDQARNAAAALRKRPPGRRCLHVFQPLKFPDERPAFDPERAAAVIRRGIRAGEGLSTWYRTFFESLAREPGANLDRIVLDYEKGLSFWHLGSGPKRVEAMRSILADEIASRKIPEEVGSQGADAFANTRRARKQIQAFNEWADLERARVLYETIVRPARTLFGDRLLASNYNDVDPAFPIVDMNDWPRPRQLAGGPTGSSSPELYLLPHGNRYRRTDKPGRWNRFLDCISTARALAHEPERLVPWISLPHYSRLHDGWDADPFLWQQLIAHLLQFGVREFILWNPKTKPGAEWYTRQVETVFRSMSEALPESVADYPAQPVVLDRDRITTGGVTTTYDDYLDHAAAVEPGAD